MLSVFSAERTAAWFTTAVVRNAVLQIKIFIFTVRVMKMQKCRICGAEFVPTKNVSKYCSDECRKKANHTREREWKRCHPQKRRLSVIICRLCGKPVDPQYGGEKVYRPKIHEECIYNDLMRTVLNHERFSPTQKSRMNNMGITLKEIKQRIHTNGTEV